MRYCIFWLWIFLPAFAHAQGFYALADSTQNYHLDQEVEILKDEAGRLAFEQILQPDIQKQFKRYGKTSISLGYFYKPVWLKISLQNPLPHTQWLLEIPMPILDTVSFYQQVGKEWKRIQCGYYMPHSTRPVPHTGFAFPLQFSQQKTTLYIQVKGTNPKIIPIRVIEKTRFYEKVRHEDVGYGILFGIFLIMFCYNLMIYITLRDINYLFYLATILCTTSFILTISGYGAKYLWADYPMMNIYGARGAFAMPALPTTR
jgi:hypothetical protein